MPVTAVRGMHDLFGHQMENWSFVEKRIQKMLTSFGYAEIRTPVLEKKEVFTQAVGADTDIVEKQMYQTQSSGEGAEVCVLRPEGTAGFIRAVVEHGLHKTGQPQRYYYYLPMFRYERPQKGRLRQFHQFGAELILDPTPEADAETITLLDALYGDLGLKEYEIRVNSVGCHLCRPGYKDALKKYFQPHLKSLCEQCQKRFERAPMRILDCKNPACAELAKKAPLILDHLGPECREHHDGLKKALSLAHVKFVEDPHIVRGLDYYCKTAFEFTSNLLGAQSALGGGGRYDGLSERFGEAPFPAVGWALGMERILIALEASKLLPETRSTPKYFFAALGQAAHEALFPMSLSLRKKGIWVAMSYDPDKRLKNLMKQADRSSAQYTVLCGDDELKKSEVILKKMGDGTQETLSLKGLENELIRRAQ